MTQKISKPSNGVFDRDTNTVNAEERYRMIAEAAYYRALNRPYGADPLDDWLQAEQEINGALLTEPAARKAPTREKRTERGRAASPRARAN